MTWRRIWLLTVLLLVGYFGGASGVSATAFGDAANGDWNIGTTWGGACAASCVAGTDYPGSAETATINSNTVTLTQAEAATTLTTASGGTLDIAAQTLTVSGTVTFSAGSVVNSNGGTIKGGGIVINSGSIGSFGGAGAITLEKTGSSTDTPGVTTSVPYANAVTFKNSGTGTWRIEGGTFSGDITFLTTSTGGIYPGYDATATSFNGNVIFENTGSATIGFGWNSATAVSTLADGKTISVGPNGFAGGTLSLRNFTQTGSTTAQALTLTGTAILTFNAGVTFNSNVTATAPQVNLNGATFNGTADITKNGGTSNTWTGGNTFNGATTITNSTSPTAHIYMTTTSPDIFNADVTFTITALGYIYPAYQAAGTQFNGNIIVNATANGGVYFGSNGGTSTLADTKTITVGVSGFNNGQLAFKGFTQTGTTAQSFTLTTSAYLYFYTGSTFNGNVNFSAPRILLSGTTFNGNVTLNKTGSANNDGVGGNTFGNEATDVISITNSGSGYLRLANTNGDTFNGDVSFVNSGSSYIEVAYNSISTFAGNFSLSSSGSNTIAAGTGTVEFTKTSGTQTFDSGGKTVKRLTHSGAGTLQLVTNNLTVNTTLTNSAGTLDLNGKNLTPTSATFTNDATIKLTGDETVGSVAPTNNSGSTVEYAATSGTRAIKDWTYDNLKINGSGGTFTSGADETLTAGLWVAPGTFDISTGSRSFVMASTTFSGGGLTATNATVDVNGPGTITSGTLTAPSGTMTVSGDWNHPAGTFTHSSGTVSLDGTNQTITGATTFYNLSKADGTDNATDLSLSFQALATTTVSGLLTFNGLDDSDRVNLVSSSPGTYWGLTANGTFAIDFVDVTDSDASLGTAITLTDGVDGGHNLNWNFTPPNSTPTLASLGPATLVDGSWTTDNTPTLTFTTADADSDTVAYELTVDDTSSFSSPVYQATSAYAAPTGISTTTGALADSSGYY